MKTRIVVAVCAAFIGFSFNGTAQTVQYVTLYSQTSTNLPIQANQLVSLVGYDWQSTPEVFGILPNGYGLRLDPYQLVGYSQSSTYGTAFSQIPQIVTGLTNVGVTAYPSGTGVPFSWATFQITTPASANVVSNYVPADAIVIPASATGDVQIILESSPDLMNWAAANPGTYSASSATNRFFRVRAVHN